MHRILVLDSDPVSLSAIARELRRAGNEVAGSKSGRSGLALATTFNPHVLLIDLQLSDMSGLDVVRESRQKDPQRACLLISRYGHDQDRAEAMKLGAVDCIEQPLNPALLLAVVHNAKLGRPERNDVEESYALTRWADVVVRGSRCPTDIRTILEWGRAVAVSRGAIRNWCYTAHLSARYSLQFTRVLRAISRQRESSMAPEDLLDIVDRRTLAKLLRVARRDNSYASKDHGRILRSPATYHE